MMYGTVREMYPEADTKYGKVKGENRDGAAIFRGIPYGGACDGARRFQAPQPPVNWEGVRDCTKNGYYAPQFGTSISGSEGLGKYFSGGHPEKFGVDGEEQGENCLVLNVVTPGCSGKRPVVVYIHGGGFETGSGTLVLGADGWAREEDLVIVGVNHRLNLFGYLYLGGLDEKYADSGTAGMLDLILALKWVQENISHFGGDPEKVTIMGESGGGAKVSTLLAMKEARGLFRAAIVESGSLAPGLKTKEEGTAQAREILKALQVPEDRLELLEEKTTEELLEAMKAAGDIKALEFSPVADGIHLDPQTGYTEPEGAEEIPLLVGASEDETAVFTSREILERITWENLEEHLKGADTLESLYEVEAGNWEEIIRRFRAEDKKGDNAEHLYTKICSQCSVLGAGAYYQAMKKAGQPAPVFAYVITCDTPHPMLEERRYAWHTADLPLQMRIVLYPECEGLSRYLAHAWAAFIRSLDPSTEQIKWPPFTRETKQVIQIGRQPIVSTDPWKPLRETFETYGSLKVTV